MLTPCLLDRSAKTEVKRSALGLGIEPLAHTG